MAKSLVIILISLLTSCISKSNKSTYVSDLEDYVPKDSSFYKTNLTSISKQMIRLAEYDFTENQVQSIWIGNRGATPEEIKKTEDRLRINLPNDYRDFILTSNGFQKINEVEPTFFSIGEIDYLKNVDTNLIEIWKAFGTYDIGKTLEKSIIIGGIMEEQSFLLIPPDNQYKNWRYWKFAAWIPGEEPYENLKEYFSKVLEFMNELEQ
ncbi:SMI1/KNR4 family protein [Carboxylicivirga linearis]|uniref:SMI1/KNR4 family protein n=1 Tax=Carboxylicivirga linearis TaxID=1628157 RepID=A0ABS5JXK7_9BACT|nr:SMI1/KNR4 family protein [Carboxylicivirga linearis]MBS2099618.1 SMI1/KNR4 family protein [Carboxylicivirga linearis]